MRYRFGHSMLTETLNIDTDQNADGVQQMSLIEAFANPLGYLAQRAGSIVAGSVSQVANGIDEFVTGALRNNRRHVKTLMLRMGMEALYRRPRTTKPEAGHKVFPYLLRGIEITRPNQVWAMDITYIPMAKASSISRSCSTGSRGGCCRGGCRSRWKQRSASRRCRRRWRVTASRRSSTRTKARSHRRGLHGRAGSQADQDQHGRQGRVARQRVHRAPVADDQVRGGLPARLRERQKELTASSHPVNPLHVNQSSGVDMRRSRRTTASLCASSRAA